MDVIWLVDEYLGNGKARHAAFSSKRRAIEVAGKSCDHSSKVILVEWTYCHPLSVQQLFPVRTDPVVYESSSVYRQGLRWGLRLHGFCRCGAYQSNCSREAQRKAPR